MAGSPSEDYGVSRSSEQAENGIASTALLYWDTDDDDRGPNPSDLYGKFTWKIDKFSHINKRECRSNAFEIGGCKWYILIYPQGSYDLNHLSLFLCVANHDKLLPGWSHFAQFTVSVVNKDPKKSKYSDTLHRFWKKEHDWGWKRFMELSKMLDGFLDDDTLTIKAQVQVIRERADRPFRCLDHQYRRELVRVYMSNVEQIFRRFVEERRGSLGKLIEDKVRWSGFCNFWLGIDQNSRHWIASEKLYSILKVVVKHFFIEKAVTSTLVMDSLYSGLKALEGQSQTMSIKAKGISDSEEVPIPVVRMESDSFVFIDDVLLLLERAALEPLPPKDEKGPQNRTKDGGPQEDFSKDSIEHDERRLTELGRRAIEIFVVTHIFGKIEVAYQEELKRQEELVQKQKTYKDLQVPLQEIVSVTNNFADENIIKEGRFGKDYKGQMLQSGQLIDITARRFDCNHEEVDFEFLTEISMLFRLEHKNIISLIGFCDEKDEKIIIYEHAVHGSLEQHLSDPTLTWFRRLQICLGVARALTYIHYDVIHCDINSSNIFLDKDWDSKIYGFQLSTKYPQSWRHRLLFSRYFDNTIMTPKYDVYSFGVLLFELLCGKKPIIGDDGVKEELDEIIDPNLRQQMDTQSLSIFTKIAYNCLDQQPVQRPTMESIVKELEAALEHQWKHENLGHLTDAAEATLSSNLKAEWLKIPLSDIMLATNNFHEKYCVGFGGFGIVYKGELDVLDIQSLSSLERKCKDDLPKRSKTVAIKRIFSRPDDQGRQGFLTEIELLSSCKHPNIVSLLGFCREAREMILVYEFAFKGSLNDYFGSTCKTINLTWVQRIQICLDVAHGINYLHTNMEGKPRIIHRDIKSENILLDENLKAKVADFGLSKFHLSDQQASTVFTKNIAGTEVYLDPEYLTSFKYKKESDIYSFGVVLFEILSGRVAYDPIFMVENDKGLAPIARRLFNEGMLKELIDPKIIEEDDEHIVTLNRGPNQDSFEVFSRIAYQCLAETQAKRPTMEAVIKELQSALNLQGETMVLTRFRLNDILLATKHFSETYCIGLHTYGMMYKAELEDFDNNCSLALEPKSHSFLPKKCTPVAIKRISSSKRGQRKEWFFSEIEMRTSYKHRNIVSLIGICDEGDELALIYEHASSKSLDDYLRSDKMNNYTWTQRLRMCLEIARGLDHLHTKMDGQQMIIHGDIRCANILLGKDWEVKIAYFGISKFHPSSKDASTKVYCDPEYEKTSKLKKESDIYSFGVVLFEIFCGRLAYDPIYIVENDKGLAPIARRCFNDRTINKLIDPKLKEETEEHFFTSCTGLNQGSLNTFSKIAYQCLGETQAERPAMEVIIKELELALNLQEHTMKSLQILLNDIEAATENFDQKNCIGSGRYWKAYKGDLTYDNANGRITIVAKRWDSKSSQGDDAFLRELDILFKCKHKNIIGLVGYCNEMNEQIIVYEHTTSGSLDRYLKDANLTWMRRLKICIDVASALEFLHGGAVALKKLIHMDIKSQSILLNNDWKAKLSSLELSSLGSLHQDMRHVTVYGAYGYIDPRYNQGFSTEKSDIYSFGMVLFEVLCGRLAWVEDETGFLGSLAKKHFREAKLDEIVFEGIKEQIVPEALTAFADVAYQCLSDDGYERPDASEVLIQLEKALEFQEDYEIWEPRLPRDYKDIMQLKTPDIYYTEKKKDLYKKLCRGIFLQKEKVWLILSGSGKTNKMISATMFSYEKRESHKWRSIHKSRFGTVAKMLDISNLKIQITVNTQFLSPDVFYRVNLVFKFCDPRKYSCKPMYVNLKYRNSNRFLHSYFATWRDDGWMMIELCRFLHHKEDFDFQILLESLSRYHCRSDAIYIEGIEFQARTNVAHEDIDNQEEGRHIENPISNTDQEPTSSEEIFNRSEDEEFWVSEVNGKKHLMLFAGAVLYNSSELETFRYKASDNYSRSQALMVLLPKQVFRIKYKIESQMLSPFTEYACYLVFQLSEKSRGLHCPVKVRDLLHRRSKEAKIIYFRSPTPLNQYDSFWVPVRRKDEWMEVVVWEFNSKYKLGKNIIPMNLKLIAYEGTMSGLIIRGLEFRPV